MTDHLSPKTRRRLARSPFAPIQEDTMSMFDDSYSAAAERYRQARERLDAAARAGDWDGVRRLAPESARAANEASRLYDARRKEGGGDADV